MKSKRTLIIVCVCVIAAIGGIGLLPSSENAIAGSAMTELNVQNLSCGSCVAKINEALDQLSGIESVDVSVSTGRSSVIYDASKVDANAIAQAISSIGYPASVVRQLTTQEYQSLQSEESDLAKIYVAKIGDRLLARDEFEKVVNQRLQAAGLQNRPEARPQVVVQAWQSLKQRILLLADAERNNIVIQNGEVDIRLNQIREKMPNLDDYIVKNFGNQESFTKQLKEDMIINRNIDQNVLAGISDPIQRQKQFNNWFQDLIGKAPVTIYDTTLKQAANSGGGGCGGGSGGCCG